MKENKARKLSKKSYSYQRKKSNLQEKIFALPEDN